MIKWGIQYQDRRDNWIWYNDRSYAADINRIHDFCERLRNNHVSHRWRVVELAPE